MEGAVTVICFITDMSAAFMLSSLIGCFLLFLFSTSPQVQTASGLGILITEGAFLPDTAMFPFDYLSNVTLTGLLPLDRWPWYWLEVNSKLHCWVRWRISIRVLTIRVQLKRKRIRITCHDAPPLQHQAIYRSPSSFFFFQSCCWKLLLCVVCTWSYSALHRSSSHLL